MAGERGTAGVGGGILSVTPTWTSPLADWYARNGGPWDGPSLDVAMARPRDQRVARIAGGLHGFGVRAGDAVTWQAPNSADIALLYRACWRIGAVAAPVHHLAGAADVAAMLEGLDAVSVSVDSLPDGDPVTEPWTDGATPAVVLFTSGSSGTPKGVIHTQRGLAYKAQLMASVHQLTTDDVVLMPAPMAHISGLLNGVLLPGIVPMGVEFMARWQPDDALDLIERAHVSFMIGPPTFFITLMGAETFTPDRVASLRLVSSGGAGVTPAFVDTASATLGCIVKRTYGSTEAPTITTSHAGDDPDRARATDGRPTGDLEVRIAPKNGEIEVRGPELFCGYTDPTRNDAVFTDDGWFRTGDRGELVDGWLTVTGRLKDVVIRGGENISVAEVEAVLEAHSAVRQAVVVGAPDDRLGEVVVAFVVIAPDAQFGLDETRDWFAAREVARFKTPERLICLDSIPVLASGKPDRAALVRELTRPPRPSP